MSDQSERCAWYVLRTPRTESGPCGKRAIYVASVVRSGIEVRQAVCGTHSHSAMRLGHELVDVTDHGLRVIR